jgi:hypothetical protein
MLGSLFKNGKMEIRLAKHAFVMGELIEGVVTYALDEPMDARALVVGLRATQRTVTRSRSTQGPTNIVHQRQTVYEFKNELGGEATYRSGERAFTLVVPEAANARGATPPSGILGDIARAASFLSGNAAFPLEWEVFGYVDIPWKLNVKKGVPIAVTEAPARVRIG